MNITKLIIAFTLLLVGVGVAEAKSPKKLPESTVEIENIGKEGTLVLKVWETASKPNVDDSRFIVTALQAVLFQGIPDSDRMKGRKALVKDGYEAHKDYFNKFFIDSRLSSCATLGAKGYMNSGNMIKVGKSYRVAKIVVVRYSELRKRLETDGIIKSLDNGF